MNIDEQKITEIAGREMYFRGMRLVKQNRVKILSIDVDRFEATVQATWPFRVHVQQMGDKIYHSCNCPYFSACEHVVAALLKAKDWYAENLTLLLQKQTHPDWREFFSRLAEQNNLSTIKKARRDEQHWKILFVLSLDQDNWSIAPQKAYLKKNGETGRFSNVGEVDPESSVLLFSPNDPLIISYLQHLGWERDSLWNTRHYGGYRFSNFGQYIFKYGSQIGPIFDLLRDSEIRLKRQDEYLPIEYHTGSGQLDFTIHDRGASFEITADLLLDNQKLRLGPEFAILTDDPTWILHRNNLIKINNKIKSGLFVPFAQNEMVLQIPKGEFPAFIEEFYTPLSREMAFPLPENLGIDLVTCFEKRRLILFETERHLEVKVKFLYGDHEVDFHDEMSAIFKTQNGQVTHILRDRVAEQDCVDYLLNTGLKKNPSGGLRMIDTKALDWMFDNLPKLLAEGFDVFGQDKLKKYRIRTGAPSIRVAVTSKIDWFDLALEIDVEGIVLSLKELKKAIRNKQRFVRLADHSLARLPEEWYEKFQHLFNFSETDQETVKVSRFHVTLIDRLFQKALGQQTDAEYRSSLQKLGDFSGIQQNPLPQKIDGILRPYQRFGYDWLTFLNEFKFGGCLADDMGLGKTLQTLTVLLREKEKGIRAPSLIVCPTSVVFNWENEVKKFTPDLKVLIHSGIDRNRHTDDFRKYDIILTSYGIMRRDILFFKDFNFHYVILDESQKIKNPHSQTAKAARVLKAEYRLVLTGTPVENNTVELWSQFAFLNPGLLGALPYFQRAFATPIEKHHDEGTAQFLKQLIYPFILRRTKELVAPELPPKTEQTLFCAMNPSQEKLYGYWRDYYRAMILDKIDTVGLDKSRMNILEGLVKLRQIACHPYLVDQEVVEDSGKFENLKEIIEELVAENHKVLVFSQFVRMLKLIRAFFEQQGIRYEYLDGHTLHRHEPVSRFQNDPAIKAFLISLKAGGTGLNLTAADYVIHFDPWWNPAVEVQATDRAHRIGQDKNVFVYRLVTKNTVEEKMLELQERKRQLVSDLIGSEKAFFKTLTRQEIEVLFS